MQAGVIVDNPGYSSYNPEEAPAEFIQVSGDVALSNDQLCSNGGPPPNYNQPGFQFNIGPQELPISDDTNDNSVARQLNYYPNNK